MTQPALRHASLWRRVESLRQRVITVVVLDDDFLGALAYALQRGLDEPAAVRAVRVRPSTGRAAVQPPIPVANLIGSPAATLKQLSAHSDLMVVQKPSGGVDRATDRLLADLRRDTKSLLVEVDDSGEIVRTAGPDLWS